MEGDSIIRTPGFRDEDETPLDVSVEVYDGTVTVHVEGGADTPVSLYLSVIHAATLAERILSAACILNEQGADQ